MRTDYVIIDQLIFCEMGVTKSELIVGLNSTNSTKYFIPVDSPCNACQIGFVVTSPRTRKPNL